MDRHAHRRVYAEETANFMARKTVASYPSKETFTTEKGNVFQSAHGCINLCQTHFPDLFSHPPPSQQDPTYTALQESAQAYGCSDADEIANTIKCPSKHEARGSHPQSTIHGILFHLHRSVI